MVRKKLESRASTAKYTPTPYTLKSKDEYDVLKPVYTRGHHEQRQSATTFTTDDCDLVKHFIRNRHDASITCASPRQDLSTNTPACKTVGSTPGPQPCHRNRTLGSTPDECTFRYSATKPSAKAALALTDTLTTSTVTPAGLGSE